MEERSIARVPANVQREIVSIARDEHPKKIAVLQLPSKYQHRFGKDLLAEKYGFKSLNDFLASINQLEIEYDNMLTLWFIKFKPNVPNEDAGVDEDVEMEDAEQAQGTNHEVENGATEDENDIVLDVSDAEDLMIPPDAPGVSVKKQKKKEKSEAPTLPTPSASVSSISSSASSNVSGKIRGRRLPPPPPSVDWERGARSVLGKRQGSVLGENSKRRMLDEDVHSDAFTYIDESIPPQDVRKLRQDQDRVRYIKGSRGLEKLTYDSLLLGKKAGRVQDDTYVDTTFCERDVLESLMTVKNTVKKITPEAYQDLQTQLNTFSDPPTVFQFETAYLYANIDALSGFALTRPTTRGGSSIVADSDLLYAIDILGGPGGFVEYMLTKLQWEAKVYGFAPRLGENSYNLTTTGHYPKETFEHWVGWDGNRGEGSIYVPKYVDNFAGYIHRNTNGGAHVVVGSGQIKTVGADEDRKELRCKQMILAETLIALTTLRDGGTFVMRLYDVLTPYTAGLVYLMYRSFEKVAIIRPETCRQGSSERFLLCKHYKGRQSCTEIINYLTTIHGMDAGCHLYAEIIELVKSDTIVNTKSLFEYIFESNTEIGRTQLDETRLLCRAIQSRNNHTRLVMQRKAGIKNKCAEVWNCPRQLRQEPRYANLSPEVFVVRLLRPYPENAVSLSERVGEVKMVYTTMERDFTDPLDWHFVPVGRDRGFYLGRGENRVYRYYKGKWKRVGDPLEITNQTLVYGDIVDEIVSLENNKQVSQTAFHIIDGLILGGKDIRNLPYLERMKCCSKFAASMCKPSFPNLVLVRAKIPHEATSLERSLATVHEEQVKGGGDRKKRPLVHLDGVNPEKATPRKFVNTGYLFLKTVKTIDVHSDFIDTMQNRIYWEMDEKMTRNPRTDSSNRPADPKLLEKTVVDATSLVEHIKRCFREKNMKNLK